jgi:DNA polymerase III subunit chi
MKPVTFHFGALDKIDYTCRLLRKARRTGATVTVCGTAAELGRLDQALWVSDPLDFVPHVKAVRADRIAARLAATPLLLLEDPADSPARDVLVHLGPHEPPGAEGFGRWIEIVSQDEEDRLAARRRWRQYEGRGLALQAHKVPVAGAQEAG